VEISGRRHQTQDAAGIGVFIVYRCNPRDPCAEDVRSDDTGTSKPHEGDGEAAQRRRVMALHAQTLVAVEWPDEILPTRYGYPFKTRIPTKTRVQEP
jgi:hypothetical protein